MTLLFKNVLFTLLVPGTVAGLVPWWLSPPSNPLGNGAFAVGAGGVLMATGVALYLACIWPFATIGRGTPAPIDAPRHLVVVGPYRFVRNPMYIAVLLVIFGQAVMHLSTDLAIYGAIVGLVFALFVVTYEELVLGQRFGDEYRDYRNRVPRWLPRLPEKRS